MNPVNYQWMCVNWNILGGGGTPMSLHGTSLFFPPPPPNGSLGCRILLLFLAFTKTALHFVSTTRRQMGVYLNVLEYLTDNKLLAVFFMYNMLFGKQLEPLLMSIILIIMV